MLRMLRMSSCKCRKCRKWDCGNCEVGFDVEDGHFDLMDPHEHGSTCFTRNVVFWSD